MSKIFFPFLFVFLTAAMLQCKNAKHATHIGSTNLVQDTLAPKILFVHLNCAISRNGQDSCALINTQLVEGQLTAVEIEGPSPDGYACVFTDLQGKEIARIHVENPLRKRMEAFQENGSIQSHQVSLKESAFSIRIQYHPSIKWLKVWHSPKSVPVCISTINLSGL